MDRRMLELATPDMLAAISTPHIAMADLAMAGHSCEAACLGG